MTRLWLYAIMNSVMKERNNPHTTRYEESTESIGREAQHSQNESNERRAKGHNGTYSKTEKALAFVALPLVITGIGLGIKTTADTLNQPTPKERQLDDFYAGQPAYENWKHDHESK